MDSKTVFQLRREGQLHSAYTMAQALYQTDANDPWVRKALAWCLYDLAKQALADHDQSAAQDYLRQWEQIEQDPNDDLLNKSLHWLRTQLDPITALLQQARAAKDAQDLALAQRLLQEALHRAPEREDVHTQYAWILYYQVKALAEASPLNVAAIKPLLLQYLGLKNPRPSLLHSLMLKLVLQLVDQEGFKLLGFLKLWDLHKFQPEDEQPYHTPEGKEYPALAERTIQLAAKLLLQLQLHHEIPWLLPFVERAAQVFPHNPWLVYYQAQLLQHSGQPEAGIRVLMPFVKTKMGDFWAWSLLADLYRTVDTAKAMACYGKALSCGAEDKYLGPVRLHLAELLVQNERWAEASCELQQLEKNQIQQGWKLPEKLLQLQQLPGYKNTPAAQSNHNLYQECTRQAEALIIADLPLREACLAEKVTHPDQPHKVRRRLLVRDGKSMLQVLLPEKRLGALFTLSPGTALWVRGEQQQGQFQVYHLEARAGAPWDCIPEYVGVVDHVNAQKGFIHFIVSKTIAGVVHAETLPLSAVSLGTVLHLRLVPIPSKEGHLKYRAYAAQVTEQAPPPQLLKSFAGLLDMAKDAGFVDDVFIPPALLSQHQAQPGAFIRGRAVLNYNAKRSTWGWKAIDYEL